MKLHATSPTTQGFDARLAGKPLTACPYAEGSIERECWLAGWRLCWIEPKSVAGGK